MKHKAGFVNIVGNPNVGKSTLTNALVGERLSIITSKAQTTRHRIMGIVNEDDYQIVFSDTPGILKPSYLMQEGMMNFVTSSFQDADIIILVIEMGEKQMNDEKMLKRLTGAEVPVLLLINKVDLASPEEVEKSIALWNGIVPNAQILPISALEGFNVDTLMNRIIELLPESPPYFPKDEMTDKPMRFFISEIIREKILLNYSKEIPYSCEVIVEEYHDEPEIVKIRAIIMVMRDSQRGIIIGHQGKMIKKTGTMSRQEIEQFINKKVFLDLYVKVDKDWRNKERNLKNYGYL